MIHFNIIFPFTPIPCHLSGLFPSSFHTITLYTLLSFPCHMPCQSNPLQYWHPNNTWLAGIAWLQARRSVVQNSLKKDYFWIHADQPQGPPNLLCNLYKASFPGVNQPGLALNTHPHLTQRLRVDTAHLYLSSKLAWHVTEQLYLYQYVVGSTDHQAPYYTIFSCPPFTFTLWDTCIFLSTLFLDTLSLWRSHNLGAKVSHSYRQQNNFVCLNMKIFRLLMEWQHSAVNGPLHRNEYKTHFVITVHFSKYYFFFSWILCLHIKYRVAQWCNIFFKSLILIIQIRWSEYKYNTHVKKNFHIL
jgi:hypothetical protein